MKLSRKQVLGGLALLAVGAVVLGHPFPPFWNNGTGQAVHYQPVQWPSEPASPAACTDQCGDWKPYTRFNNSIKDPRVQDPSNGGTAPQNYVNVSSSCTDKQQPSIYYYLHQATNPADDVLMFRWRVEQAAHNYATGPSAGNYSATNPWSAALWTVLFDVDGSGYRTLAAHLDGSSGSPSTPIDLLAGIWGNTPTQSIDYNEPNVHLLAHNPTGLIGPSNKILNFRNSLSPVESWPNGAGETVWDYGTTRAIRVTTSPCTEYFIDYQIPVALLDASGQGGPKITRSTPIAMLFCTANSLNNPFQKDCAINRTWTSGAAAPAPFGDYISFDKQNPYQQPIVSSVTATEPNSCPGTYKLQAKVQDALALQSGVTVSSVQRVDFYYWYDRNGDGSATAADTGSEWTRITPSATLKAQTLNTWLAEWDASALPKGKYLIGVQALDEADALDDDMVSTGVDNRTFSYLSGDSENRIYVNGAFATGQQASFPVHSPVQSPSNTENWYGNPSVTGNQVALVGTAINTCGVAPTLSLSRSPSSVASGGTVNLSVAVANPAANSSALTLSSLTVELPDGFAYVVGTSSGNSGIGTSDPQISGSSLLYSFNTPPTLSPGATATLNLSATAGSAAGTYNVASSAVTSFGNLQSAPVSVVVDSARVGLSVSPSAFSVAANGTDTLSFTLRYSNDSGVAVSNASIANALPSGATYVSCTGGTSCSFGSGSVGFTIGALAAGASGTASYSLTVPSSYAQSSLTNSAMLSAQAPDASTVSASASSTVAVTGFAVAGTPAFTLTKTASAARIDPGTMVTYTLSYTNYGGAAASNVVLTDTLPSGMTFSSCSGTCSSMSGVVTWNIGSVAAGASGSRTLTVTAATPFTATNPTSNSASINWTGGTPVTATASVGISGQSCSTFYFRNTTANVGFDGTQRVATVSPVPVMGDAGSKVTVMAPGAQSNYLEAVRFYQDPQTENNVPFNGNITSKIYIDRDPGNGLFIRTTIYDYDSATGAKTTLAQNETEFSGSQTGQLTVTNTPSGTLAKGHRLLWIYDVRSKHNTQTVEVELQFGGTVANGISNGGGNTFANSNASYCVNPPANLTLTNTVDQASIAAGSTGTLKYTLSYANTGVAQATNLVLRDTLPTGFTNCEYSLDNSTWLTCSSVGTSPQFHQRSIASLTGSSSGVLYVRGTPPATTGGEILTNTATLSSDQTNQVSATAATTVAQAGGGGTTPALSLLLSANRSIATPGQSVTYTLTVVNTGDGAASNVVVSNALPTSAYYTYAGCTGSCNVAGSTLTWPTIASLAAGASQSYSYTLVVGTSGLPAGTTVVSDDASASGSGGLTATSNSVSIAFNGNPQLSSVLTAAPSSGLSPGDTVVYRVDLSNTGAASANAVQVEVAVPERTSFAGDINASTGSGAFDAVDNTVVFTLPSLASGASAILTFKATLNAVLPSGSTQLQNAGTVVASNASQQSLSASISASAAADLFISNAVPSAVPLPSALLTAAATGSTTLFVDRSDRLELNQLVLVGNTVARVLAIGAKSIQVDTAITASSGTTVIGAVKLVIAYGNAGNADAAAVVVDEALPSGLGYYSAAPSATTSPIAGNSGTVSWSVGALAAGASGTFELITFPTGSTGSFTATATASAANATSAVAAAPIAIGGLSVIKTTSTPVLSAGAEASYSILTSNSLSSSVLASITDALPEGFSYKLLSATVGGVALEPTFDADDTNRLRPQWANVTVPANGTLVISFTALIDANAGAAVYQNDVEIDTTAGVSSFDPLLATSEDVTVLPAASGVLQGFVFERADNNNADFDASADTPLAGVRVELHKAVSNCTTGSDCFVVFTDSNGYFSQVLPSGAWIVSVIAGTGELDVSLRQVAGANDDTVTVPNQGEVTDHNGFTSAAAPTFFVSTAAGAHGSIAPNGTTVTQGATTQFNITPDSGYAIASTSGCGGSLTAGVFTTAAITANCTVSAYFAAVENDGDHTQSLETPDQTTTVTYDPTVYTNVTTTPLTGGSRLNLTIGPVSIGVENTRTNGTVVTRDDGTTTTGVTSEIPENQVEVEDDGSLTVDASIDHGNNTRTVVEVAVDTNNLTTITSTFEDGSPTTTHVLIGIPGSQTTIHTDGSVTTTTTAPDGTVITITIAPEGTVTVVTDPPTAPPVTSMFPPGSTVSVSPQGVVSQIVHAIAASASPNGSAVISGDGDYAPGAQVTLVATANPGFTFVSWTEGSTVVASSTSYSFTASTSRTLVANFSADNYLVTATAGAGGSITPASRSLTYGATGTFTVTADSGYSIDTVSGCSGNLSGATFTTAPITGACAITATFAALPATTHQVTATAGTGGSITPTLTTVSDGATTSFMVTPNTGYHIASVTGCNGSRSGNLYTTGAITAACSVSATFALNQYTVSATAGAGGNISPAQSTVTHGQTASFTVTPNSGFNIDSISGCNGSLSGSTYTTAAVTATCSVTASFVAISTIPDHVVSATAGMGGSITPAMTTVTDGATTSFTVTANAGYGIASVTGCNGSLSGTTYTTGPITAACTVAASFSLDQYTVSASAGAGGSIGPATATVLHGQTASFTLTPNAGFRIDAISGCPGLLSGNTFTTAPITASCAISASFAVQSSTPEYQVNALAGTGGTITPALTTVTDGATTSFMVTPSTGYRIASVTGCNGSRAGNTYTTGPITAACSVSATFALNEYTVTASAGAGGSIGPAQATVTHGQTASFTLTPDSGFNLDSISGCGGSLSGSIYTTAAVTAACSITASFVAIPSTPEHIVSATAGTGGTITPAMTTVTDGATASFMVTPTSGYGIASVTGCSGSLVGTTYTTGPITAACTVAASFSLNQYTVSASAGAGGSISPATTTVLHGQTASFTLMPDAGFRIDAISGCNGMLSGHTFTTSPITASCALSASFAVQSSTPEYQVNATAGVGGSITPALSFVTDGATASFMVTANTGYNVAGVTGCGGALAGNTYTTAPITAACTVSASFVLRQYTVSATAGSGGSINPAQSFVTHGQTTSFTLTPDAGYHIDAISGCGGMLSGTTFVTAPVTATCAITASFAVDASTPEFQVSASAGTGGSITPALSVVTDGATASFVVTPSAGYDIASVTGCGGALSGNTYTTAPVSAACAVTASFTLRQYLVSATAGAGGSIGPAQATVAHGQTTSFTLTANVGQHIANVSGCGGVLNGTTFVTAPITAACAITASFAADAIPDHQVTASAGTGGSITPSSTTVSDGATGSFTVTANTGYSIGSVSGCGGSLSGTTYITGPVTAACAVTASFTLNQYTVTATASTGGSISPAQVTVAHGQTASFTLSPASDFNLGAVSGCGGTVSGNSYVTGAITGNCSISAGFVTAGPSIETPPPATLNARALFTSIPTSLAPRAFAADGTPLTVTLVNDTPRRPGRHTVTWRAQDAQGRVVSVTQDIDIWPTVSLGRDVRVSYGSASSFEVVLNGEAPSYPLPIAFTVEGTGLGTRHTLASGILTLTSGTQGRVHFEALPQARSTPDHPLTVILDPTLNLGERPRTNITLTGVNVAPVVTIEASQSDRTGALVAKDAGPITLRALIEDANSGDSHSVQWTYPPSAAVQIATDGLQLVVDPASLSVGLQGFTAVAIDNGTPSLSGEGQITLALIASSPQLGSGDSNGNSIPDATEGWTDSGNGIPAYLNRVRDRNVLPEDVPVTDRFLVEGDPGVRLRLGAYAQFQGSGARITSTTIATLLSADLVANTGGYFDVQAQDLLAAGSSVRITFPQRQPIPADAIYRQWDQQSGRWNTFVEDANNVLSSAPGTQGYCPPAGSSAYAPGLTAGHWCVQVTIEDGGKNDTDHRVNAALSNFGGVGMRATTIVTGTSQGRGGGGAMTPWTLALLALLVLLRRRAVLRKSWLACLALLPVAVWAQDDAGTRSQPEPFRRWYLGANLLMARGTVDAAQMDARLARQGYITDTTLEGQTRTGGMLFAGYRRRYWGFEAAYTDLGELETRVAGNTPVGPEYLAAISRAHPQSGSGPQLSLLGYVPLGERLEIFGRAGMFYWQGLETSQGSGQFDNSPDRSLDPAFGLGAWLRLTDKWSAGVQWNGYRLRGERVDTLGGSLLYRFR